MNDKEAQLEKLRKVLELARRGVDGEKESAKALLERLMAKYGVTLEELGLEGESPEEARPRTVWVENWPLYHVLYYCFHFVCEGNPPDLRYNPNTADERHCFEFSASSWVYAQGMALYEVMRDAFNLSEQNMAARHKHDRDQYAGCIKKLKKQIKELEEDRKGVYSKHRKEREWLVYSFMSKNDLTRYCHPLKEGKGKEMSDRDWNAFLAAKDDSEKADSTLRFGAQCLPGGES